METYTDTDINMDTRREVAARTPLPSSPGLPLFVAATPAMGQRLT